jgi:hypothetical protein
MWRSILLSFITGAVCLGANSDSPEGTWATQIVGRDHGICYLTFSNDFSVAGYGITLDALGPFQMDGSWILDSHQRLVGGFTQFIQGGGAGAKFRGKVNNNKLRVHVNSTGGSFNFKGDPAGDIPDLTGPWVGEVRVKGKKSFVMYDATLSTNVPAWFDLAGSGTSDAGTFTVTGGILATPDNQLAAFTVNDTGTSTDTAAFIGKVRARGKKLVLRGRSDGNDTVVIRATRP